MTPQECNLTPGDIILGKIITGSTRNYTVDSKLGEGGFGIVYLVKSSIDGKSFALKVLKLWALNKKEQDRKSVV